MTYFRLDIGARRRTAGRLLGQVRSEIVKALVEQKATGLSQQRLAAKLGVERRQLNRQLTGEGELTLRAVADLAWALDREISFELRQRSTEPGQNYCGPTSTIAAAPARVVGEARTSSTVPLPPPTLGPRRSFITKNR